MSVVVGLTFPEAEEFTASAGLTEGTSPVLVLASAERSTGYDMLAQVEVGMAYVTENAVTGPAWPELRALIHEAAERGDEAVAPPHGREAVIEANRARQAVFGREALNRAMG